MRNELISKSLTLNKLKEYIRHGIFEDEFFDFKEEYDKEVNGKDGKDRFRRTVVSFANADGGFIVFGVTDKISDSIDNRVVGIPIDNELNNKIGSVLDHPKISSRIYFELHNPPLKVDEDKAVYILEIFSSASKPVAIEEDKKFLFPIRSSRGGLEHMRYAEVIFPRKSGHNEELVVM